MTRSSANRFTLVLFCTLTQIICSCSQALAQSHVTVDVSPRSGTVNDVFVLTVAARSEQQDSVRRPVFDNSAEFTVETGSTSTQQSFSFGADTMREYTVTYTFQLTPRSDLAPGRYSVPPGRILINGSEYRLKQPQVDIVKTEKVESRVSEAGVDFTQFVDPTEVYLGQQVTYRAVIATRFEATVKLSDMDWKGFWREAFGDKSQRDRQVGKVVITSFLDALFPVESGDLTVPARQLTAQLSVPQELQRRSGDSPFDGFFPELFWGSSVKTVTKRLQAPALALKVKPLPTPPMAFEQPVPVGSVSLNTDLSQTAVEQGESITMTVTVSGDANLRSLKLPEPTGTNAKDFKIYHDNPETKAFVEGDRIKLVKTFKVALVPLKDGTLQLPKFTILSFDPVDSQYRVLSTTQKLLTVAPNAAAQKLIVAGTSPEVKKTVEDEKKQDVALVGEDLLPQHIGPQTLLAAPRLNSRVTWFVFLFAPVLAVGLRLFVSRRVTLFSDPKALRQKNAHQKALAAFAAIDKSSDDALDIIHDTLRTYLGERFRTQGESLTARDAEKLLAAKLPKRAPLARELPGRVEKVLSLFQRIRFSGGAAAYGAEQMQSLLDDTVKLIDDLERSM